MNKYDIIIIGAGPGGYVAALYAAGFGKKILVVDNDQLGGVCLNCGCIPTKTLAASVHALRFIKGSKEYGVDVSSYSVDYKIIRKSKITDKSILKFIQKSFVLGKDFFKIFIEDFF